MKLNVGEIDIIYLSYDEPNAEQNYTDLLSKVPWAKRIHGIKGSDAAHKACAELAETDRFVTVDGDNTVDQNFINQVLEFDPKENLENSVISWCGKNTINGLVYGNGGLKCWPKQYVLNMKTHENADKENINAQIEFCWDARYVQMADCFSNVHNNATPYQAWRAGFRKGVKLALNRGARIPKEQFLKSHQKNLAMLYIWCMVGADVKNGSWAIYGAREGLFMTMCSDWDYVNVRDFDCLNELWGGRDELPEDVLHSEIFNLGNQLIDKLEIPIAVQPLNEEQSNFFKSVNDSTVRKNNYK